MRILKAQSVPNARYGAWRQYEVIKDQETTLIEVTPAIYEGGWKVKRISYFGADHWPNHTCDQIVKSKTIHETGLRETHEVTDPSEIENILRLLTLGHEIHAQTI